MTKEINAGYIEKSRGFNLIKSNELAKETHGH